MRLRSQILSILNTEQNFFSGVAQNLEESQNNIEVTCSEIIAAVINVIYIQCIENKRTEEICKMAKECSMTSFTTDQFQNNSTLSFKGNGINSELFADKFGTIVGLIARKTRLKASSVKMLFSILTPLTLSHIYRHYTSNNLTFEKMAFYLKDNLRSNKIKGEVKSTVLELVREHRGFDSQTIPIWSAFLHQIHHFWAAATAKFSAIK